MGSKSDWPTMKLAADMLEEFEIAQMPGGVPVGTLAIGESGAKNAALLAARVLANDDSKICEKLEAFIITQTQNVLENARL